MQICNTPLSGLCLITESVSRSSKKNGDHSFSYLGVQKDFVPNEGILEWKHLELVQSLNLGMLGFLMDANGFWDFKMITR